MSHAKERKEKNCLNCNAIVAGRYCQVCGQENIETQETFGHLAGHFISDIFHFDGLFFSTAKRLLFHPGFLTYEYVRGRRASYLNPIKMYVFISAIFFLFFLTVYKIPVNLSTADKEEKTTKVLLRELQEDKADIEKALLDTSAPVWVKDRMKYGLQRLNYDIETLQKDSTIKPQVIEDMESASLFSNDTYTSVKEYDSIQQKLPKNKRDGWLIKKYQEKNIDLNSRFHENKNEMLNAFMESFFHHFPQILFISLPIFALILQLLYVRRKQFFYANHIIYTIHLYCAVFIFIFLLLLIDKIDDLPYLHWLGYAGYVVSLYAVFYTYKAMRTFYDQGRIKTIVKWVLLNSAAFFVMIFLFILLALFTMLIV